MIKKIFSTILYLFIFTCSLFNQNIVFSDTIVWQDNKIFQYDENNKINILNFEGCDNRKGDNLPIYYKSEIVDNNVVVSNIELLNVKYEIVSDDILRNVDNINNIKSEPEVNAWISISRRQYYLDFELVPLRRNQTTGLVERITYFEYKVSYTYKIDVKSSKSRSYTSSSKLSSGKWYKFKLKESGMYKLTYSQILEMGFTNFNNIGVFGYGGMLSKIINDNYIDDLPELPVVKVDVNNNSVFDEGDYILFYADGPHNINYNLNGNFSHEFHEYSEYSYYFISDQGTFKTPYNINSLQNSNIVVNTYDDYKFMEKDSINLLDAGRRHFWRVFDSRLTHNFSATYSDVSLSDDINVKVVMLGKTNSGYSSSYNVVFNGVSSSYRSISGVSGDTAGKEDILEQSFRSSSNTFNLSINFRRGTTTAKGWLDYISFSFRRNLSLSDGFLHFRDIKSVGDNNIARFVITNAASNTIVWDVTDRTNIFRIQGDYNSSRYEFSADAKELREYIAFNPLSNFSSPIISGSSDVGIIQNQNLHSSSNVDLIIVTHPLFYAQAQSIKLLHERHDNIKVVVATPDAIYNEFSSGTPDISAIRNFVKMYYDRAGNIKELPKNLLLVGDGSYNNRPENPSPYNFIFTYQSDQSLNPNSAYVTDDFYVYMDNGEGTMTLADRIDVGVGRIPVRTADEAQAYYNKLVAYYGNESYSNWKNNIILVADDANDNETLFHKATDAAAKILRFTQPVFNIESIYLDDYEQVSTAQGHRYPAAKQALNDAFNNGAFMINWIGHGNPDQWAHEIVLDRQMIKSLRNTNKYPIVITGTCEFTPFDRDATSGGEDMLLNPLGGAIALFTTTKKVGGTSGEVLFYEFIDNIFDLDENSDINTLGVSVFKSKNARPGYNRQDFTYIGDPAIRPPLPKLNVKTTKINGVTVDSNRDSKDTIKAKTLVTYEGIIENADGSIAENFNGIVYPIVYDKFMKYTTRNNDGAGAFTYEAQKNILFKGQVRAVNGRFSFSFIVPVDIAYFYDYGKVSYYATDAVSKEARGYYDEFIIGGVGDNAIVDNDGPVIELYMNDEQFVPGGITDEKPIMLAKITDESGINTVGNGIGHDLTLMLDDNTTNTIVLNKFYESAIDDFRSGEIKYPMTDLSLGSHVVKVKAWDVFNNSSEMILDFVVANSSELVIDHIFNYPNPFSTNTHFYLAHNKPYINMDVLIQIFTVSGKHVRSIRTDIYSDGFQSQPIHWDGRDEYGDKIAKGVYIYKVSVKTPDGDKVERFEKLMILN